MKIVNILGGLGNQMFQYAFAIALQSAFPEEKVKLNVSAFHGYPLHNGFELDSLFEVKFPYATRKELAKVAYPWVHYRLWQVGTKVLPCRKSMVWDNIFINGFDFNQVKDKSYFDGYWQSPKFFNKYKVEIVKAFRFPDIKDQQNQDAVDFIKSGKTAFVHVRRGDYINHPLFGGICDEQYYHDGIGMLISKYNYDRILIFSNDIEWCESHLTKLISDVPHIYVNWNRGKESYKDLQLMNCCHGALVANSSFSWWGAWLGDMEVVIGPKKWTNAPTINADIIPDSWLKI